MNSTIKTTSILVLCFFIIGTLAYGQQGPKLNVERYFVDFGTVEKGKVLQKELIVENVGDEPLIIKGLFVECECVKANIDSERILANQKTKLKISYDTKDNPVGRDNQGVYIISNDPHNPKLRVTVSVDVNDGKQPISSQEEQEIYAKVKCCNCEIPFQECVCYHAKEMKAYIKELLAKGESKENIFFKLAKKYSLDSIIDEKTREEVKKRLVLQAGDNRPQIFIETLSYDLGTLEKSKKEFVLKVKVENRGNEPLEINKLRASCVCATIKLKNKGKESPAFGVKGSPPEWKEVITPGKTAELIIALDLAHPSIHIGKLIRSFEVRSNDPVNSLFKIEVEANVVE